MAALKGLTMSMEGLQHALSNLDKTAASGDDAAREVLAKIGFDLLGKAVRDAPVEFGDLRGSGYAVMGENNEAVVAHGSKDGGVSSWGGPGQNTAPSLEVGFGVRYATRQHEEVGWNHPLGGRSKYLEVHVKKDAGMWVQWVAEALKWRLGG